MEPVRISKETLPVVSLPRADVGLRSGAEVRVHCMIDPVTVRDAGRDVIVLEPFETAVFEAVQPTFLWWTFAPRWVVKTVERNR